MRLSLLLAAIGTTAIAMAAAQVAPRNPAPIRFVVRSADPYFVVAMLEGRGVLTPEISTLLIMGGAPPQAAQAVSSLFSGGKLVVSPADNSIWFFPDRR